MSDLTEAAQPSKTESSAESTTVSSETTVQHPEKAKSIPDDAIVLSREMFNYLVVGVTFLIVGMVIGTVSVGGNTLDEATVEQIVRQVVTNVDSDNAGSGTGDMLTLADDDPYLGEEDAPIVIVEFSAYGCPYCGRHAIETLEPLLENYGEHIRYVYRDFPTINPHVSLPAAVAANCAREQGLYWEYHNALFENQTHLGEELFLQIAQDLGLDLTAFDNCRDDAAQVEEVNNDYYDGLFNNIQGTPSFFINGQFVSGAQPYEFFERIIERELARLGIVSNAQLVE